MTEQKYPMPALTEQEHEAVIRLAESDLKEYPNDPTACLLAKIILATLTAEPVYQERRFHVKGKLQIEYWAEVDKSAYQYIHESHRRIIYTAPPVPVLKPIELPKNKWRPCDCIDCVVVYDRDDVIEAIRAAGYEVKE